MPSLVPADGDGARLAAENGADALLVSRWAHAPGAVVLSLSESSEEIELRAEGQSRRLGYGGLQWLADLLASEVGTI